MKRKWIGIMAALALVEQPLFRYRQKSFPAVMTGT